MRHELTRKNASRGPHVDGGRVELGAEEDVRRAVPQRDDLGRVAPHRDAERPRQPEVGQLQLAALVDQQVLGLQVAVQDVAAVAVREAAQQLKPGMKVPFERNCTSRKFKIAKFNLHERLHNVRVNLAVEGVEVLLEVLVAVLEDQGEFAVRVEDVVEADNVAVVQLLEQADFAQRGRRDALQCSVGFTLLPSGSFPNFA